MESNNIDRKVKEALDKRTISPSAGNWEKLSQQLELQEEKKKPTYFFWYGVSAGIAAMLVVGLFAVNFFSPPQTNNVVNTDPKDQVEEKTTPVTTIQEAVVNSTPNDQPENKEIENVETPILTTTNIKERTRSKSDVAQRAPRNPSKNEQALVDTLTSASVGIAQTDPMQKLQESVGNKTSRDVVTDAEIDALLADAMAALPQKKETTSYAQVNAKQLLQSVEVETEESFNNKVFEAFKEGFKTVRTAFLERND